MDSRGPLDVSRVFEGKRLVVLGGTGFLGKVFWGTLVHHYPNIGKIYLLVRSTPELSSEARFWKQVATSECLEPFRTRYKDGFEAFLREKFVPIDGDLGRPQCGVDPALVDELRGTVDAVVNVAGIVDFNPPLDEALDANAFGAQNIVLLARALGDAPLFHTSTCYVAGKRSGLVLEQDPTDDPFPRAGELGKDLWDPDREIAECLDLIAQARHRSDDAFRQSGFSEQARKNLVRRGEPTRGPAFDDELARVKRKFVSERLVEAGVDRANHWGWPNIYTYTKSIGEQVIARSGLPFVIARPACCESTLAFPFPGWNEGISTSAPITFLSMKGQVLVPARHVPLDFIPTDMVCAGMVTSLAELLERTHAPVYQYGVTDTNPCTAVRLGEQIGLYKRKYYQRRMKQGAGNPLVNALQAHLEPYFVSGETFDAASSPALARATRELGQLLRKSGPLAGLLKPAAGTLDSFAAREEKIGAIIKLFVPFTTMQNGPFSCANTRAAYARLSDDDKAKLRWTPEAIDWIEWNQKVHLPAFEKRILPVMEEKLRRELKPLQAHATLATLVDQMAERHDLALALQRVEKDGLSRVTFRDVRDRSRAVAARLAEAGVAKGDRVILSAKNHPDWAIAYFGIVRAGATAVPVDPSLEPGQLANIVRESGARVILDESSLHGITEPDASLEPPDVEIEPGDIASLIYTSGTTGTPKGVKLTHANFTSLIAALAPVFPLTTGDRVLSVLPLHHTFEFTCGLLLPFSRGARVAYLDELTGDRLTRTLQQGRVTAMVGVPALWQLLERRILAQVKERGPVAQAIFTWGAELNRLAQRTVGVDLGKILFGGVHEALGGHVKYLISGGAALPGETQRLFLGLGLKLTEGYGLTEAAPVLTVSKPTARAKAGNVGRAIPGVEIRIGDPDDHGVGEVLARGPNVMAGYTDEEATKLVLDEEGWLRTGDLGKLDKDGRLTLVGRLKEVIVTATGENVYPDDLERQLGKIPNVEELAVVGIEGKRGGEQIACLAVPQADETVERAERLERARANLRATIAKLPFGRQPAFVHLSEQPLPRTATRKVKRGEVRAILLRMIAAAQPPAPTTGDATPVRIAIAAVRSRPIAEVTPASTLQADLGFDSLALSELLVALEVHYGALDPEALAACRTVEDVEGLVAGRQENRARSRRIEEHSSAPLALPPPVQEAGKRVIGLLQDAFYGQLMKPRVYGRAHIPHNRNTIVVANHASHLDMGFVRHALGDYGADIVTLAAQDYFFESGWRRTFFENLTNLKAIDRRAGLRQSERQAADVIARGQTLLIFPEGTRSPDGDVHEFKPLIGHLALTYGIDVLPVYLGGTHASMPKGAAVPYKRDILARIGPPLAVSDLRRLTDGMSPADAARQVARLARSAVLALKDGEVLDLARVERDAAPRPKKEHPLVLLFAELEQKFKPGQVPKPISYYFTLGNDTMAKWTVKVDDTRCEIRPGKPESGTADCVLKTSPEIFTRIVRDAYTPGPAEFLSGAVKSNDVELLLAFQKAFQLG